MSSLYNIAREVTPPAALNLILPAKAPIALVYMPWGSVSRGSIAISILKECAKQIGILKSMGARRDQILLVFIFEGLGVKYMGPIDGHDLPGLINFLGEIKHVNKPVVLHVKTRKGQGYEIACAEPTKFHSPAAFSVQMEGSEGMTRMSELMAAFRSHPPRPWHPSSASPARSKSKTGRSSSSGPPGATFTLCRSTASTIMRSWS